MADREAASRCCCPSRDAHRCLRSRNQRTNEIRAPLGLSTFSYEDEDGEDLYPDDECECACHGEYEEDEDYDMPESTQAPEAPPAAPKPEKPAGLVALEAQTVEIRALRGLVEQALRDIDNLRLLIVERLGGPGTAPAHLDAPPQPTGGGDSGPVEGSIADDKDLEGAYGNPEIRRDPPRWTGQSFVGCRFSEASAEYLAMLAGFMEWKARESDKKDERVKGGALRSKYLRLDAARALGWRARQLKGPAKPERKSSLPRSTEGKHKSWSPGESAAHAAGQGADDMPPLDDEPAPDF